MKNTLTIIGAIAIAIGVAAAVAVFVKKYTVNFHLSVNKKPEDFDLDDYDDFEDDFEDDITWEEVPVEEEEDLLSETIDELDNLDKNI